jgi:hypothetical protein
MHVTRAYRVYIRIKKWGVSSKVGNSLVMELCRVQFIINSDYSGEYGCPNLYLFLDWKTVVLFVDAQHVIYAFWWYSVVPDCQCMRRRK